jgi:hypothetical protein
LIRSNNFERYARGAKGGKMSNYLTKPYEISLWKDGPSGEEKICTIGTDTMEGQNRAFEPTFSRNVNGVKKLSFKIYKKYVDT